MDVAAERNVRDSYVMTEAGGEEEIELRVPSNRVRLVGGFEVPPNKSLQLLFDWDMRKGLVYPPGQRRKIRVSRQRLEKLGPQRRQRLNGTTEGRPDHRHELRALRRRGLRE